MEAVTVAGIAPGIAAEAAVAGMDGAALGVVTTATDAGVLGAVTTAIAAGAEGVADTAAGADAGVLAFGAAAGAGDDAAWGAAAAGADSLEQPALAASAASRRQASFLDFMDLDLSKMATAGNGRTAKLGEMLPAWPVRNTRHLNPMDYNKYFVQWVHLPLLHRSAVRVGWYPFLGFGGPGVWPCLPGGGPPF